ncbi:MAG: hypothetical protein C4532_11125 [Candidatus Abyssobacteria bacterium SURF_17]|uniref:Uncharacterized protein n=1 Tax=Candidatus Abyssobacteria bacterium SURF_17 TaxID=2093361 RepID=A0A419EXD2_9BACT|nr:MAG: hypothetical protein C4532_11125 [Candidatus Abyssubacteria bacterium SURF_17]
MDQQEIDRLINDIQEYLNQVGEHKETHGPSAGNLKEVGQEDAETGLFISAPSRNRMERFLKYSPFASYAVEALTIALFTAGILVPFSSWPRTLMFLIGVLLFGIFTITVLLSLNARIQLLVQIESNTRRIARQKEKIARVLDRIRIE